MEYNTKKQTKQVLVIPHNYTLVIESKPTTKDERLANLIMAKHSLKGFMGFLEDEYPDVYLETYKALEFILGLLE